jgi:hypothetical protein
MPPPPLGPFTSEDVAGFLSEYEFTANPAGVTTHYRGDLTYESDSLAYLDINAIAVRRGDVCRTARFTLRYAFETNGVFAQWKSYLQWNWRRIFHQRL